MSDFTELPIIPGQVGRYHLNRFRICVRGSTADATRFAGIGAALLGNMPHYMDPHTAKVSVEARQWRGSPTLRFVGKARIKPFSVPIYDPIHRRRLDIPVPEKIRDWMVPDVHPDFVGTVAKTPTSFTAQTLKRNYIESSDMIIKAMALAALAGAEVITGWIPLLNLAEAAVEEIVAAYIIWVNTHHFLAGRRSFRFDKGSVFGYTDGRYVFETAAMERFSLPVFEASQALLGSAAAMVRPVWIEMVQRFCAHHGLQVIADTPHGGHWQTAPGDVNFVQQDFFAYNAMLGSSEGRDIAAKHPELHP